MVYRDNIHKESDQYFLMFITIDQNDRRPIYEQVAGGIRTLIANGALKEGAELPPVRQVAADLGVNLNTIATAYRELGREGLIQIRHGQRAVVANNTSTENNKRELRKRLRTALTELALAGLSRPEILNWVSDELAGLLKGTK
jgi:GntR family transcriptional regulator